MIRYTERDKMNTVKFIWVSLYLVSAVIHAVIRNEPYHVSFIVVFPVFIFKNALNFELF